MVIALAAAAAVDLSPSVAQTKPVVDEKVVELSPFVVSESDNVGYAATSTLAGTRIKTNLADLGAAISVVTREFMEDVGAKDLGSLLSYTSNTEVGGAQGNFSDAGNAANNRYFQLGERENPQSNTRIRGLGRADLTRGLNLTDIGFDSYNTERVTVSRGPNSLLFGIGSPAGVIDADPKQALQNKNLREVAIRMDNYGTLRSEFDLNQAVVKDRLAVRVAGLRNDERYQQQEAWTRDQRFYGNMDLVLFKNAKSSVLGPTRIRANGELGTVKGSPPDVIPPSVSYTGWFKPTPSSLSRYSGIVPAASQRSPADGGTWQYQATYNPLVAITENQIGTNVHPTVFRNIALVYNNPSATVPNVGTPNRLQGYSGGSNWSATRDTLASSGLAGTPAAIAAFGAGAPGSTRLLGPTTEYTTNSPFAEPSATGFAIPTLQNTAVFDYRNHVYSGGIDRVERKFHASNVALEQSLFRGKLVFQASYDKQHYQSLQDFFFQGARPLSTSGPYDVYVSIAQYLQDGQVNPNFGRAYTRVDKPAVRLQKRDRETFRLTLFGEVDFAKNQNWLKHLGRHRFTGLYSDYTYTQRNYTWFDVWEGVDFNFGQSMEVAEADRYRANRSPVDALIFTSDSLLGLSSMDDVRLKMINISRPQPGQTFLTTFADFSPTGGRKVATGTVRMERYLDSENIQQRKIKTKAIAWQNYFLKDHIIGLVGYRKDDTRDNDRATAGEVGLPDRDLLGRWNPAFTRLSAKPSLAESGETLTWSAIGRYPKALLGRLPGDLDLQVHFASAENFNPIGARHDAYGTPLGQPTSTSREYGFLVSKADNKVNLKVNWYKTGSSNESTGLSVPLLAHPINRINNYRDAELNLRIPFSDQYQFVQGDPQAFPIRDYATFYDAVLNAMSLALRKAANITKVDRNGDGVWDRVHAESNLNLVATQSRVARGVEVELVANPTENWRVLLNVSQQQTVNSDTAALALKAMEEYTANLKTTRVLELREQPEGTSPNRPISEIWYAGDLAATRATAALDGTVSNEQREWRVSGVTSYTFSQGWLRGLKAGGAVRWESAVVTGYETRADPAIGLPVPIIAHPFKTGPLLHGDVFFSFKKKFTNRIGWQVQLNIRNAFGNNDDIPVKTNPDGMIAVVRIPSPRTFTLSNTFSF